MHSTPRGILVKSKSTLCLRGEVGKAAKAGGGRNGARETRLEST